VAAYRRRKPGDDGWMGRICAWSLGCVASEMNGWMFGLCLVCTCLCACGLVLDVNSSIAIVVVSGASLPNRSKI
jgi:hypothetical protein